MAKSTPVETLANAPFTLALSSGFFGFYAHVGFLKALTEVGLKPSAYSGASAGAIIAAAAARGLSVREIEELTLQVSRKEFWDPSIGLGLLKGRKLREYIAREIGDDFAALDKPLRLSVFDINSLSTRVLTSGSLSRGILASCAVPLMFQPVRIGLRLYWDGGIQDKMAIHGLPADQKILSHYLENRARDVHSLYELRRDASTVTGRRGNLVRVPLTGLPRSGPFALDRGPDIIREAHRAALVALQARDGLCLHARDEKTNSSANHSRKKATRDF